MIEKRTEECEMWVEIGGRKGATLFFDRVGDVARQRTTAKR